MSSKLTDQSRSVPGKMSHVECFLVLLNISYPFQLLESVLILLLSSSFVILSIQYLISFLLGYRFRLTEFRGCFQISTFEILKLAESNL